MKVFQKEEYINGAVTAFDQISTINGVVDKVAADGFKNVVLVGVGGSLAFHLQMEVMLKVYSTIDCRVENASELVTIGNPHLGEGSLAIFHSRSGDTKELVDAAAYAKEAGAKVLTFVEKPDAALAQMSDYVVPGVGYYFLYLFYTYLMYKSGAYPEYPDFIENFRKFPAAFADSLAKYEPTAKEVAERFYDVPFAYVIGAGALWGWTYSFAMCVMEETMWMHTKSVQACEFFHGTLEVIERDSNVLLLRGEDASRPLIDRAENFTNRICNNVCVIDTVACQLEGIDGKYREILTPIICEAMCRRITAYFEELRKHPGEIRRYYRALTY